MLYSIIALRQEKEAIMDISKYRQELRVLFDDERELIETFLVIRGLLRVTNIISALAG